MDEIANLRHDPRQPWVGQTAFAHKGATRVTRYLLPNLPAMNFVIDDALEGGVNGSLS